MTRYIDADALIECLERHLPSNMKRILNEYEAAVGDGLEQSIYVVEDFEAADVRPNVRGEWNVEHGVMMYDDIYGDIYRCSECGHWERDIDGHNFCLNCGADMRGE